ncbi:MAG: PAS domain-containing protein [Candidatus Eisenbacteria bacterium]
MPEPSVLQGDRVAVKRQDRLSLPVQEYALLVPFAITRSAIVTHDSGNLPASGKLPAEVFLREDILTGGVTVSASDDEMSGTGLEDVFAPAYGQVIRSVLLDRGDSPGGILLSKSPASQPADEVGAALGRNTDHLDTALAQAQHTLREYERSLLSSTFRYTAPCLVVNESKKTVFANAMFSELVGIGYNDLIGSQLTDFIHLDKDFGSDVPLLPEYEEVTTPLFVKTQSRFFVSDVRLSRLSTPCGDRFIYSFSDLSTERRRGNSNIQLIQKLSAMMISEEPPQTVLRRLVNALALTLDCDLVCIMQRKNNNEMIATPYTNRRLETLRINFIQPEKEPVLQPYLSHGAPVLCDDVEKSCDAQSFFRRVLPISRFALVPAGDGPHARHALLMAWSRSSTAIGTEALPLLKVAANLLATILASARQGRDTEQERDMLRRYTALTTGREAKMAGLKKENAHLRELLTKLSEAGKE